MTKNIEITDILNTKYKNHRICELIQLGKETKEISIGKLDGDMSPTQARNFFESYELLIHQPNTSSGFLATLFQDKESKEFILAMRGTK